MTAHLLFAVHVALAWFFALNVVAALVMLVVFPLVRRAVLNSENANVPLAWRFGPLILSLSAVLAIVMPAYIALEPRQADEHAGWVSMLLAGGGAAMIVSALIRGCRAVHRTSQSIRARTGGVRAARLSEPRLRAYAVPGTGPLMMLAGVMRPRLLVSYAVLDILSDDELRVALAHELAHHRAADNAKRQLLAFAPDLFGWTKAADELVREWTVRAEVSADRVAASGDPGNAVHLASALVKVARLASGAPSRAAAWTALHDGAPIAHRVRLLLQRSPERGTFVEPASHAGARLFAAVLVICAMGVPVHRLAHQLTEILVHLP